jgi:hypothetical protein
VLRAGVSPLLGAPASCQDLMRAAAQDCENVDAVIIEIVGDDE